jgi:WD40 repeat protein
VAFSPDNRLLAYPSTNYTVKIWDVPNHREAHTLSGHGWNIYNVTFSPDGQLLATSSWDGRIRLWNPATGQEAKPPLIGHRGGVRVLEFTTDGKTLLAADDAGAMRAWHVATGSDMQTIPRCFPLAQAVASPDGTILLLDPPTPAGSLRLVQLPTLQSIDAEHARSR